MREENSEFKIQNSENTAAVGIQRTENRIHSLILNISYFCSLY